MERFLRSEMGNDPRHTVLSRRGFVARTLGVVGAVTVGSLLAACGGDDEAPAPTTASSSGNATTGAGTSGGTGASSTAPALASPGAGSAGGASASPGSATSQGQPKKGGTLIDTIDGDPPTLNGAISSGATDGAVASKILEGLVRLTGGDYAPQPLLAKSWEISDDGLQYTFHLQENVKFHDGQPFTAADVKYTMQEVVAKYQPQVGSIFKAITSVDTPDNLTVVVRFEKPYGPFMNAVTTGSCPMLPKHLFEGTDPLKNAHSLTEPVGTGPFTLGKWDRGQSITLERNPNYWQPGKPYLDRILMKVISQPASRTAALKTGEVDYCYYYFFDVADYGEIKDDKTLQHRTGAGHPEATHIIINNRNKPFDDKRVRQALFMAIDREFLVEAITFGLAKVAKSSITPLISWAYNPEVDLSKKYPYDPQKANALLDEAGLAKGGNGKRFPLRLVFDAARSGYQQFGQTLSQQWDAIGVDVTLVPVERQVMLQQVFMDWNFDASIQMYTTSGDPALGISRSYVSTSIGKQTFNNGSGYSNPKADELFAQGAAQATHEKRAPFYREVQTILAEDVPVLNIYDGQGVDVGSSKVDFSALWGHPSSGDEWEGVWRKE